MNYIYPTGMENTIKTTRSISISPPSVDKTSSSSSSSSSSNTNTTITTRTRNTRTRKPIQSRSNNTTAAEAVVTTTTRTTTESQYHPIPLNLGTISITPPQSLYGEVKTTTKSSKNKNSNNRNRNSSTSDNITTFPVLPNPISTSIGSTPNNNHTATNTFTMPSSSSNHDHRHNRRKPSSRRNSNTSSNSGGTSTASTTATTVSSLGISAAVARGGNGFGFTPPTIATTSGINPTATTTSSNTHRGFKNYSTQHYTNGGTGRGGTSSPPISMYANCTTSKGTSHNPFYNARKQKQSCATAEANTTTTASNVVPAMLPPLHTNSAGNTPPKMYYTSNNNTTTTTTGTSGTTQTTCASSQPQHSNNTNSTTTNSNATNNTATTSSIITSSSVNSSTSATSSVGSSSKFPLNRPTRECVLKRLADALTRRSLTMIDMSQRGLQPNDAKLMKLAILQNSSLSVLKLGFNHLCDDGVTTLSSAIASHGVLSSLDLGFNNVGDDGCVALANALISSFSLRQSKRCTESNGTSGTTPRSSSVGASGSATTITTPGRSAFGNGFGSNTINSHNNNTLPSSQTMNQNHQPPHFDKLYLAGNRIREEGAQALAKVIRSGCGLKRIYLTSNSVGPDGIRVLMESIVEREGKDQENHDDANASVPTSTTPQSNDLSSLDFKSTVNRMNSSSSPLLMNTNNNNNPNGNVEELHLGGTGMGPIGCASVAKLLEHSCSLRVLSLANCSLGDEEGILLAEAISNNPSLPLQSLQLSFNEFTCKSIEPLMNAICQLRQLADVRLDNNQMEERGARAVSCALGMLKSLTKLDIGFNSISGEGMKYLMKAIAENKSLVSLCISGNAIDTISAKAVAYALSRNRSLKSLFLDHCDIGIEGQQHITAGIVSNCFTDLQTLTGFQIGGNVVYLGFPAALEHCTNDQVLKFVMLMYEQMRREYEESEILLADTSLDPISQCGPPGGTVDPKTVVAVAKNTYEVLSINGEILERSSMGAREAIFESPLSEDAIILEANGTVIEDMSVENQTFAVNTSGYYENGPFNSPPIGDLSIVHKKPMLSPSLDLLTRKKKIMEWLSRNNDHLNELTQLPFNSSELWRLHQHFFTPVIHDCGRESSDETTMSVASVDFTSNAQPVNSTLSEPFDTPTTTTNMNVTVPTSEPVMNPNLGNLSMLKRKVSYRHLHESTIQTTSTLPPTNNKPDHSNSCHPADESVSRLIEGLNGHSMQPRSKRARRNGSRISSVPRIKDKLDSFLDSCHQRALVLMRQLKFVEKSLLESSIYPLEGVPSTTSSTYLSGQLAADAEMILLDIT